MALDPDNLAALVNDGRVWLRRDRPDLALASLSRARALAPGNQEIRRELGRATSAGARSP